MPTADGCANTPPSAFFREKSMSNERLIKKYPNRRLYDTEESRYITLAEVKDLVMNAVAFRVVDSQNEADITRAILLQIIMEQEAGGNPLFTAAMLERFIRFYGDTAQAAFTTFLGAVVSSAGLMVQAFELLLHLENAKLRLIQQYDATRPKRQQLTADF